MRIEIIKCDRCGGQIQNEDEVYRMFFPNPIKVKPGATKGSRNIGKYDSGDLVTAELCPECRDAMMDCYLNVTVKQQKKSKCKDAVIV